MGMGQKRKKHQMVNLFLINLSTRDFSKFYCSVASAFQLRVGEGFRILKLNIIRCDIYFDWMVWSEKSCWCDSINYTYTASAWEFQLVAKGVVVYLDEFRRKLLILKFFSHRLLFLLYWAGVKLGIIIFRTRKWFWHECPRKIVQVIGISILGKNQLLSMKQNSHGEIFLAKISKP